MDITNIRRCAAYYQTNYLETFYLVSTYHGKSFILIGEKENFPHLMGIAKQIYKSNGYRSPYALYRDIRNGQPVSSRIIPNNISTTSKMYKKVANFEHSTEIFWNNQGPLAINYNELLSSKKLSNVDILLTDIHSGYMLGWKCNKNIQVNAEIHLTKYCISSWMDESGGSQQQKEKYMSLQDIDLIRYVFAFDKNSDLIRKKEYKYSIQDKEDILRIIERNKANLVVDSNNDRFYIGIAKDKAIHCKINGVQY